MKNHWLKVHNQKKRRFWTAEFSRRGNSILDPRRVEVLDPEYTLGYMGATDGRVELNFKGGMTTTDKEFVDFLIECRKGMENWLCTLRYYANIMSELEYYELTQLDLVNVGMGKSIEDIAVQFDYHAIRHIFCA